MYSLASWSIKISMIVFISMKIIMNWISISIFYFLFKIHDVMCCLLQIIINHHIYCIYYWYTDKVDVTPNIRKSDPPTRLILKLNYWVYHSFCNYFSYHFSCQYCCPCTNTMSLNILYILWYWSGTNKYH